MRELEVLGLAGDGARIICQDPSSGEEFSIAADEKLRAAARGDVSRIGQLEIEMESQLRPRDIQARIRAGASVADVANAAGTSISRIETFAHPVLMERSSVATKAAQCMVDGSALTTAVRDVVAARLADLGQSTDITWDAYRTRDVWVLTAQWQVGRSRNTAEFTYHPVAGGGTVIARNEMATELVRPDRSPLRTISAVPLAVASGLGRGFAPVTPPQSDRAVSDRAAPSSARADDVTETIPRLDGTGAIIARTVPPTAARTEARQVLQAPAPRATVPRAPVARPIVPTVAADSAVTADPADAELSEAEKLVAATVEDERAGTHPDRGAREQIARTGTDHASAHPAPGGRSTKSGKAAKPSMPSWDDVLLGGGRKR